ncbi:MAG TPA: SigE family RNA polymerase sigma factor [Actinospica sp.]|jgi:RNA polymerase sigma-70 factor (sigma-E family)|nr:SigE family RNA polymerase sigma factor [Actinospica sp.]
MEEDEGAFAEYAAGALARLRRVAYLLCQDWHRADDLTQTALTRLYVHWRRANAADNLDAYVGAILLNAYLSEQRTSWWKRTHVRSEPEELLPPVAEDESRVEDVLDLRAALRTLAPRRRAVVVLRYYCDYSVEQTAQMLGCSTGTVKSQTSRALDQLRDVLGSAASGELGVPGAQEAQGASRNSQALQFPQTSSVPGRTQ